MHKLAAAILITTICCACSDPSPPPNSSENNAAERAKTGYEQSLDRAREVEGQVLDAAERKKKLLEEQGGQR